MASTMARGRKPFGVVLGERVRARRVQLNLMQETVARAAGMTVPRLSDLERGLNSRGPSPETLTKLAAALQWDVGQLVGASEPDPSHV